jgi:hypothetical protein
MDIIFDIETDGLVSSRVWCMAYYIIGEHKSISDVCVTSDYTEIKRLLAAANTLIGHNIVCFDVPELERVLDIKIQARLIDTLWLSYYLYPSRKSHNLDGYGTDFGIKKPEIIDWENLSIEDYKHRCTEDVKINTYLWGRMKKDLNELYMHYPDRVDKIIDYVSFKAAVIAEQEKYKLKLNIPYLKEKLTELDNIYNSSYTALQQGMPKVPVEKVTQRPKTMYKKDGSLTKAYTEWLVLCEQTGAAEDTESITTVSKYEDPKPSSQIQLKNWLFSLGWEPQTFEYRKNTTGDTNKIPQISNKDKELCDSVVALFEVEPLLRNLEGFTVAKHRADVLRGFLKNSNESGYIAASSVGLTNTMRYIHRNIVNLPGEGKKYGEWVRSCIVAPDPLVFCGCDISALETMTKLHYIKPFDPEYVKKLLSDDYDPHLDLAVSAGYLTEEQAQAHKDGTENHSKVRKVFKVVNYSCVYGASGYTVSLQCNIPVDAANKLVEVYRKLNWSVDHFASKLEVIQWNSGSWLFNPVSKFYYSLRHDKDRFSTVNQSTGVYIFDLWIYLLRQEGVVILMNMHDEILTYCRKENTDKLQGILEKSMDKVNQLLDLNVEIKVTPKFGKTYWDVH